MGLLSLAIWTPIAFGIVLLAFGRDEHANVVRWIALIGAVFGLAVTIPIYHNFEIGTSALQMVESGLWMARFNIFYRLGVDGLSLWFVVLTAFITVVVIIAGWEVITERVNQYMGAFLILSGLMIGVFFNAAVCVAVPRFPTSAKTLSRKINLLTLLTAFVGTYLSSSSLRTILRP